MNYLNLIDGTSAAIVLGGTLAVTILRCGLRDSFATLRGIAATLQPGFDAAKARSELALQIQQIHRDGLLRAEPRHFGDREFDEMTDTLIERRSLAPLLNKHRAHQQSRLKRSRTAVATLGQAIEMAPVLGLAGTLIALSQLPTGSASDTMISTSIPAAIITTFYGLVTAHLLLAPLARFIERRADKEESERDRLIDWLTEELAREGVRHDDREASRSDPPGRQVAA